MKQKALIVVRLSRLMDESSSPERQEQACRDLCEKQGWEVVGVASDLNVSAGATSPFQRPELGQWLGSGKKGDPGRSHEYDLIVFWRLDRLVRSMNQLWELMIWADDNDVALKSATEENFDTTTSIGKFMASLVGYFAQVELEAIRERTGADQHHRIISGHFRGAVPSWGYKPEKRKDGAYLVPDPEQVEQINFAVSRILEGKSMNSVAAEMNERGFTTPRDLNDIRQEREPKGRKWSGGRLKGMLLSKTLLGYAVYREPIVDAKGKPVRDDHGNKLYEEEPRVAIGTDGAPVMRSEPILKRDVWDRVAKEIRSREIQVSKRSDSLLLNVLHCAACGKTAYRQARSHGRASVYRCSSASRRLPCDNKPSQINLEYAENAVVSVFLGVLGDSVRTVRVWDPGEDHSSEITELEGQIEDIAVLLSNYRAGSQAFDAVSKQLKQLQDRLDALSSAGVRAPGWQWQPTEETVAQWWDRATVKERNKYLRDCGVKAYFDNRENAAPRFHLVFERYLEVMETLRPGASASVVKKSLETIPPSMVLEVSSGEATLRPKTEGEM